MPEAAIVVRPAPKPAWALLGKFDDVGLERVKALRERLADMRQRPINYVSYAEAEGACEELAKKLRAEFGTDELQRFRFVAVPRGGLIVLGMLSYILGLKHSQLEPPHPPEIPLVVVDDVAISGARFGRFLRRYTDHQQVVFAHLYSHPDMRQAIEEQEPTVRACVSARDLHDHAPERLGSRYASWRQSWRTLHAGPRYWSGQPDRVCFAWNEPSHSFYNAALEKAEAGWRIMSPELCLKNRPAFGAAHPRVQLQPEGNGPLQASADVIFGELGEQIVVGNLDTSTCFTLSDVAADMWRAVIAHGEEDAAASALAAEYEIDEDTLRADLHAFVDDLLARELLVRCQPA